MSDKPFSEIELRQQRARLDLTPEQKKVFKYCVLNTYALCDDEDKDPKYIAKRCKLSIETVVEALDKLRKLDIIDDNLSYIILTKN